MKTAMINLILDYKHATGSWPDIYNRLKPTAKKVINELYYGDIQ